VNATRTWIKSFTAVFVLFSAVSGCYAQQCTLSGSSPKQCVCNSGSHTIYEHTYTDLQGRVCRTSSDPCLCPANSGATQGTVSAGQPSTSQGALPRGTYQESCSNCRTTGAVLRCSSCKDGSGSWSNDPTLNTSNCAGGIENIRGKLWCPERQTATVPGGPIEINNQCPRPMQLAIHYMRADRSGWSTDGWWTIDGGSTNVLTDKGNALRANNRIFYVYAQEIGGGGFILKGNTPIELNGKTWPMEELLFGADDGKFKISINCPEVSSQGRGRLSGRR